MVTECLRYAQKTQKEKISGTGRNKIKDEGLLGLLEIFENEGRKPEGKNQG